MKIRQMMVELCSFIRNAVLSLGRRIKSDGWFRSSCMEFSYNLL